MSVCGWYGCGGGGACEVGVGFKVRGFASAAAAAGGGSFRCNFSIF